MNPAVLKKKPFQIDEAALRVAHPFPKEKPEVPATPDSPKAASARSFTGVMACAACHTGPKFNFQFSQWRLSKHARAYAELATEKGFEMARAEGVTGDPQ